MSFLLIEKKKNNLDNLDNLDECDFIDIQSWRYVYSRGKVYIVSITTHKKWS
jgi:hypothetical protein